MSYSYNVFESSCSINIATSEEFATVPIDPLAAPVGGHVVVLSIVVSNRSESDSVPVSLALQKNDSANNCSLCKDLPIPINTLYNLNASAKIVLNREDQLKIWADPSGEDLVDVTVSYAVYTPASV
jgi:hypothetical protein